MAKIKVAIVGISGYTGLELTKLILNHPKFELVYAGASNGGVLSEIFPFFKGVFDLEISPANPSEIAKICDLVFLALPHQEGMRFAKILRNYDIKIVDFSADYRVSLENYEKNYCQHSDKEGLESAIYGLVEINREKIKNSNFIANPGCYPTCSLLGLVPFREMIEPKFGVMIDAKSGISGAGKTPTKTSHFISVNENINAYNPLIHRHSDEIKEHLNLGLKDEISVFFVPHLVPLSRGMLVSSFVKLKPEFLDIEPLEILENFYKNEPFIRIMKEGISVKNVAGTHFCDIFAKKSADTLWINSAIDNLLRGASSQALANANLICGLDERLGLPKFGSFV